MKTCFHRLFLSFCALKRLCERLQSGQQVTEISDKVGRSHLIQEVVTVRLQGTRYKSTWRESEVLNTKTPCTETDNERETYSQHGNILFIYNTACFLNTLLIYGSFCFFVLLGNCCHHNGLSEISWTVSAPALFSSLCS